jgi:hypothetical protein
VTAHSKIFYDTTLIGPDNPAYSPTLPNSINKNTFPAIAYLTLSAKYRVLETDAGTAEVFTTISNALNQRPPYGAGLVRPASSGYYDSLGRLYKIGFRFAY